MKSRMLVGGLVASLAATFALSAQTPVPPAKPSTLPSQASLVADSVAVAGDTVAAMVMLDSVLKADGRNASAWHRFGVLAWSRARSSRGKTIIHSREAIQLLIAADSALHLAVAFAPDSALFWRDLARYSLNGGSVFIRLGAQHQLSKGLDAAVRTGDSLMIADLADELGMVKWRRYEVVANQALEMDGTEIATKGQIKHGVAARRDFLVVKPIGFTGFADYTEAVNYFERAKAANPQHVRARKHIYMALAERKQWPELLNESTLRLKVASFDFEAWLARGLALQRMDRSGEAAAAFDSALSYMTPVARAEYTRITRILPPRAYDYSQSLRDSATFAQLSETEQKQTADLLWAVIDPLATTAHNEFRTEFYARVAFSDLRWTSDDLDHRGANTDRGDIHIRYGPPDRESTTVWRYNIGLTFVFDAPPTFGTARLHRKEEYDDVKERVPLSWDNVPISRFIEPMNVRLAGFRNGRDSLDVVVAADLPAAAMLKGSGIAGQLPFDVSTRMLDAAAQSHMVATRTVKFDAQSAPARAPQHWVQHVGPGANIVRVDAYQPDTRHIARGLVNVDPARATGFGMSDVLLGQRPAEPRNAPKRWSDIAMQPLAGTYKLGEPIGMVWENYDFTPRDGNIQYRVNIDVERDPGPGLRGLVARVRSGVSTVILGQASGLGHIALSFPRQATARDMTVEFITLDLTDPEPGLYHLKVEITDLVSERKTSRETNFRVLP